MGYQNWISAAGQWGFTFKHRAPSAAYMQGRLGTWVQVILNTLGEKDVVLVTEAVVVAAMKESYRVVMNITTPPGAWMVCTKGGVQFVRPELFDEAPSRFQFYEWVNSGSFDECPICFEAMTGIESSAATCPQCMKWFCATCAVKNPNGCPFCRANVQFVRMP